jgi:hypothetical protein
VAESGEVRPEEAGEPFGLPRKCEKAKWCSQGENWK